MASKRCCSPAGEPRFCAGAPRRRRRPLAFPLADEGDHRAGENPGTGSRQSSFAAADAGTGGGRFYGVFLAGARTGRDADGRTGGCRTPARHLPVARGEKNVFLLGSPAGDHDPLFRLGHSDVWFRSYVVPADTLMQYKLAPDVPQVDGVGHEQRRAILVSAQADPLNPHSVNRASDRWNRYSLLALNPARYCTPRMTLRYGT